MNFRRNDTIILSITLIALCVMVGIELAGQRGERQPEPVDQNTEPLQAAAGSSAEPENRRDTWLNEIVARPLFSANRRPMANTARSVPGLPRLTAIIVEGSQRTAIFAASSGGHPIVVRIGSHIGIYDVQDIADDGVTLVGSRGTAVIHPAFDVAPPAVEKMPPSAHPAFLKAMTR